MTLNDKFEFSFYYNNIITIFSIYYSQDSEKIIKKQKEYFESLDKIEDSDCEDINHIDTGNETKSIPETCDSIISDDEDALEMTYYFIMDEIINKYNYEILENNLLTAYEFYKLYQHFVNTFC